jgi:formate dehydrogenase major subunit
LEKLFMTTVPDTLTQTVTLTINGHPATVPEGATIWEASKQLGIEIPVLCHHEKMDPVGVCRMCVVDVGERVLTASCMRECTDGMSVETSSEKIEKQRAMLTRLLLSDHPVPCEREKTTGDCELEELGRQYGVDQRSEVRGQKSGDRSQGTGDRRQVAAELLNFQSSIDNSQSTDLSSPVIAVDHQACILCDRCVRACDEIQSNHVIGRSGKGYTASIAFDLNNPMGESTCVSCGECVASCPTGALINKQITLPIVERNELQAVDTVCPYCGVGCAITFYSRENKVVYAEGRDSPVNHGRLCVKGRYGWDYASHPQRLTKPLIRREENYPKGPLSEEVQSSIAERSGGRRRRPGGIVDYDEILPAFREATWEEALDLVGNRLKEIKQQFGSGALAGFGSAKCSNEEAYLFQKLVRAGFGTNNVDHCTRLCHASSVAALLETIGSGAVTNVFADVARSEVALVTGSHTTSNHPVAATFIKDATKKGTKLIVVDVRRHELADFATHFAQIKPGTDVAFYNGLMHVLIRDELLDSEFIDRRTEGFDDLKELLLRDYSPTQAAAICGIPVEKIEAIAHTIGGAARGSKSEIRNPKSELPRMLIFWGMGVSQHTTGTDNARCLISLCLMTGNMGKPGTGLHPLRGQNNVQGASDAGLIPIVYPDYQPVTDKTVREKFQKAWQAELDPNAGLTVVEIIKGALDKTIRGMYILGENPFISDPNSNKVRKSLTALDFLVVQDIFLTETAEFADVILPASSYFEKTGTYTNSDRRVQVGHKVLDMPGEARQDWEIICEIGNRIGLPMHYESSKEVFDEFASLTKNYHSLSHDNLGSTGKLWPCADPKNEDGTQILFGDQFPTKNGKGKFVPCPYQPADELPDEEYPFVLNTGRVLEHWHTGSMTRRSYALATIKPEAFAKMHLKDLQTIGIQSGEMVRVSSRRGRIELVLLADTSIEPGSIFIPFHFREAAANVLTTDALDPYGKIPEFKFCAVKVELCE